MPNRILREGILTSERVNKLAWPAEVFYRRLMSVVDDFGRFYAKPELLLAACYPLHIEKVRKADIASWIGATCEAGLVRRYTVEGKDYLEVVDFRQQQRAKSKFPDPLPDACAADAKQMHSRCAADAHVYEDVVVVVSEGVTSVEPRGSPLFVSLPLVGRGEFAVTEAMVAEWASAYPAVDVRQELREMRAWCLANPEKRKTGRGISRFVVAWLGRQQDKGGGGAKPSLPSYT